MVSISFFTIQYSVIFTYFPMNVLISSCLSSYSIGFRIGQPDTKWLTDSVFCLHNLHIWLDSIFIMLVGSGPMLLLLIPVSAFNPTLFSNRLVFTISIPAFPILCAYRHIEGFIPRSFLIDLVCAFVSYIMLFYLLCLFLSNRFANLLLAL